MESIAEYKSVKVSEGQSVKVSEGQSVKVSEGQRIIRGYMEDFFDVFADTANKVVYMKFRIEQDMPVDAGDWHELLLRLQICELRIEKLIKAEKRSQEEGQSVKGTEG